MAASKSGHTRSRGRPLGGGKTSEQAKHALLDAAERSLVERGYRASTMDVIAREAGYTRTMIYRHFATREALLAALVTRATGRHAATIFERFDADADIATMVVEALVVVSTELAKDQVFGVLWEHSDQMTVADYLAESTPLTAIVESLIIFQLSQGKGSLRDGVRPIDAAHHLVVSAVSLLRGLVPSSDDPELVRRYVRVFVLPALIDDPPPPEAVFTTP